MPFVTYTALKLETGSSLCPLECSGYDNLGDEVRENCHAPEKYVKTTFQFRKYFNEKKREFESTCIGPASIEDIYTVPFTREAVMDLFSKKDTRPSRVKQFFYLLDKVAGDRTWGLEAPSGDIQDTLEMFISKPFKYLASGEFLPAEIRIHNRLQAQANGFLAKGPVVVNEAGEPVDPETARPAPKGTYS